MLAEEELRDRLLDSGPLNTLVNGRIFGGRAAQNAELPHVVWKRISGSEDHALDGPAGVVRGRFSVDCYALSYEASVSVAAAVSAALQQNSATLELYLDGRQDFYEEDTPKRFRRALDFTSLEVGPAQAQPPAQLPPPAMGTALIALAAALVAGAGQTTAAGPTAFGTGTIALTGPAVAGSGQAVDTAALGLRLVRLSSLYFPDTAGPGDTLATIQFAPVGATISVVTEDAIANAFTVVGQDIRPGAGYATIPCRMIRLFIFVTLNGVTKLTVQDVDKYSAGAPTQPVCTTEDELSTALAVAAANPGAKHVIELNKAAGAEWDPRLITLNPTGSGQVILRGAGGLNPTTLQRWNRLQLTVAGGNGLYIQNIRRQVRLTGAEWASGISRSATRYVGTATSCTGPIRYFRSPVKGGVVTWDGIDPDTTYNPHDMRRVGDLFYFKALYPNGQQGVPAGRIISIAVYDPVSQSEVGTVTTTDEYILPTPMYVGDNLPNGVLPDNTGWPLTGGVPLEFVQQPGWAGTLAQARFKAEFLPSGYAGAGNYVTALKVDSFGDGYQRTANNLDSRHTCSWRTHPSVPGSFRSMKALANGETADSNVSPWLEWSECSFTDLYLTLQVAVTRTEARRWVNRCLFDKSSGDVMAWGTSSNVVVRQDWAPTSPKIRITRNIFGRSLASAADKFDIHKDILQLFAQGSGTDIRWWVEWVMNFYDAGLNTRGDAQVIFGTDSSTVPIAQPGDVFDGLYFGHVQRGGSRFAQLNWLSALRMHRALALGGAFLPARSGIRADEVGSHIYLSDVLYAAGTLPQSQQYRGDNVRIVNLASYPARNTYQFIDTFEKMVESFTPAAGSVDEGDTPLDNMDQLLDWLGGGFDPDSVPVAHPFAQQVGVPENTLVVSAPRQIPYGVTPAQIVPQSGTSWQKAAAIDATGELVNPTAWSNAPGIIERGWYYRLRKTTPFGVMQLALSAVEINGTRSEARAYTIDRALPLLRSDPTTGSFMRSTNGASINPSPNVTRRLVVFAKLRAPTPIGPSGLLTLLRGSGTSPAPTHIYILSDGRLRLRGGSAQELNVSYDPANPAVAGGDLNLFIGINYNIQAYPPDPVTGDVPLPTDPPAPGVVQAFANFRPMRMLSSGGFTPPFWPDTDIPLRFGSQPTLFGEATGLQRPIGWGLYHLGLWSDDGTGPLPDFSQWDVQRAFTSEYLDGLNPADPGNYPGRGVVDVLGPGLKLLFRGDAATANGVGLPNLAPAGQRLNMANFVNEGAPWS